MNKEYDLDKFNEENKNSPIVLIGAGKNAREILENQDWNIRYVIDSNAESIGKIAKKDGTYIDVVDWKAGDANIREDDIIIITPSDFNNVEDKIKSYLRLGAKKKYIYIILKALQWDKERRVASEAPFIISQSNENKIPKVIHYFWFSGDPFPEKVKRCLDSWRVYCPDYEIIEWNSTNYRTDNVFCNAALNNRDWAFASDFGRCDVLYRYGGIYLDTDVELVKNIDDLLCDEGFMCFESKEGVDPGSGMGAIPGHHIMKEIRDKYYDISYYNDDGTVNHPNIIRIYTDVLIKYGLIGNAEYQRIAGFAIYPPLLMSPYSYMTGRLQQYDRTYGIHHWVSAWISSKVRKEINIRKKYFGDLE